MPNRPNDGFLPPSRPTAANYFGRWQQQYGCSSFIVFADGHNLCHSAHRRAWIQDCNSGKIVDFIDKFSQHGQQDIISNVPTTSDN